MFKGIKKLYSTHEGKIYNLTYNQNNLFHIPSKIIRYAKNQENVSHNAENINQ